MLATQRFSSELRGPLHPKVTNAPFRSEKKMEHLRFSKRGLRRRSAAPEHVAELLSDHCVLWTEKWCGLSVSGRRERIRGDPQTFPADVRPEACSLFLLETAAVNEMEFWFSLRPRLLYRLPMNPPKSALIMNHIMHFVSGNILKLLAAMVSQFAVPK